MERCVADSNGVNSAFFSLCVADSNGVNSAFFFIVQLSKLMQQEVMD